MLFVVRSSAFAAAANTENEPEYYGIFDELARSGLDAEPRRGIDEEQDATVDRQRLPNNSDPPRGQFDLYDYSIDAAAADKNDEQNDDELLLRRHRQQDEGLPSVFEVVPDADADLSRGYGMSSAALVGGRSENAGFEDVESICDLDGPALTIDPDVWTKDTQEFGVKTDGLRSVRIWHGIRVSGGSNSRYIVCTTLCLSTKHIA